MMVVVVIVRAAHPARDLYLSSAGAVNADGGRPVGAPIAASSAIGMPHWGFLGGFGSLPGPPRPPPSLRGRL